MPTCFIEAPQGIRIDAKKRLVEEISAALEETYRFNDTRIFLREYPLENVAQDERLQTEIRPVCFVEGPGRPRLDAKRKLVERINTAVADAYRGIVDVHEILILINEYPLENAAADGRLQSENPQLVEALQRATG
jgi:phenylpyruvate tautomerase PptA (4-oxalocrotonate tautomerase family)